MWRLAKLDIKGFKSFADKAHLVFPEGITAVVGPNGCGKSNISDAIVWALGEQSTNVLRAQRMNDVIFQGSSGRRATGAAEVTLHLTTRPTEGSNGNGASADGAQPTLLDAEPEPVAVAAGGVAIDEADPDALATDTGPSGDGLPADDAAADAPFGGNGLGNGLGDDAPHFPLEEFPDEDITITRRLFRSGDSEYLLNGQKCLLRDVRERLMGTGLGSRACFTIGQGRIDQILSASPLERRAPIEEAAGISLYRKRRHRTQLKLEATGQDLSRVDDICSEVARQMRSLKRQAGRAKRYRKLRDRLRKLEQVWFRQRLHEAETSSDLAAAALQAATLGEEEARTQLEVTSAGWEAARREWRRHRQEHADRQQRLYQLQVQQERDRSEAARQRDRATFAAERLEEIVRKQEELAARRQDDAEIVDVRRRASTEADQAVRASELALQEASGAMDPIAHLGDVRADSDEETLEVATLASGLEVEPEHRGAVALALGLRLRLPLLVGDQIEPWFEAVSERRGVSSSLRVPSQTATREAPAAGLVALASVVGATDDSRAAVDDLLGDVWIVETPDDALDMAAAHPGRAFVDAGGVVWAQGAEIRYRPPTSDTESLAEGAEAPWRLRVKKAGVEVDGPSAQEIEAARLEVGRAEAALRAARAQAAAAAREFQAAEAALRHRDGEVARMVGDAKALERTRTEAEAKAATLDRRAADAVKACEALEAEVAQDEGGDVAEEAELSALEAAVAACRARVETVQSRRSSAEVHAAEVRVQRQHLHAQVKERLDVEPYKLLRVEPEEDEGPPVPSAELEREIREARTGIDRLGPVNLVAYEDYEVQKERFEDLDGKRRDLVAATQNLRDAIRTIDADCVTRFVEAFEAIDGYFNRIFRQLFGGGRAGMRLEVPDDPLNSGIEIVAQPPGKTLQSIRLMSGGERSMIALALMFAIFEYHPAPFCILDEADAALDDRNVARFVQALYHFQDRAQFIMITHNKRSMEVADLLYGVTMQDSGVSTLVSVELN